MMPPADSSSTITATTRTFAADGSERLSYPSVRIELDELGRRRRELEFAPDGRLVRERQLDEQERPQEELVYGADGALDHRLVRRYDADGVELEEAMYLGGERLHGRWVSRLDSQGRIEERRWQNKNGVVEATESWEYDESGRLAAKERANVASWRYRYDPAGRRTRITGGHHSADELEDVELAYDELGRLIKETRFSADGTVSSVTDYAYPHADNPNPRGSR